MGEATLTSNGEIDSWQVNTYVPRLVVNVIHVRPVHLMKRGNGTTYKTFSFTVNNLRVGHEGSEKVIHCLVHERAVDKFDRIIKPNTTVCIKNPRVQDKKNAPGNTPFSLQIFDSTSITLVDDSDDNDEWDEVTALPRPDTSRARDVESGQPLESSRKMRSRTEDFFDELKEGLLKLDEIKKRKVELDLLYRMQSALLEKK